MWAPLKAGPHRLASASTGDQGVREEEDGKTKRV